LEEQPLNQYFEENDFSSKVAIKNMGSTFVYICIFVLLVLQLPLLAIISKNSIKISLFYQWMRDKLIWNGFFAFIMSQYPPIIISCGINVYEIDFSSKNQAVKIFSSSLSLVLLFLSLASLPIVWIIIKKGRT